MPQVSSLKSLALRVLMEQEGNSCNPKSCPIGVVQITPSGTGQAVGQTVGQGPKVSARIRGRDETVETTRAEICFHCHGERACRCASCAVAGPRMQWAEGRCRACLGAGFLSWLEGVQ